MFVYALLSPVFSFALRAAMIARTPLRAVYARNPFTPAACAILAMTVIAVALVAMLSTLSISNELGSALHVSGWFS
jgi:hypothetical protein